MKSKTDQTVDNDTKLEKKLQKNKLRREKRKMLLEKNKNNKVKGYILGALFFVVDLFD